jgi:hypothetical protein
MKIMKKALSLVLLFAGLLLYGCGSSGDANTSSNGSTGGGSPSGSVGGFTLKLVDSDNSINPAAGITTIAGIFSAGNASFPSSPTDVRVVIRKYDTVASTITVCQYDDNGDIVPGTCVLQPTTINMLVYNDIQDVKYTGGGSVSVGIPQGTGYTIDVITSLSSSGTHTILKYGQASNVTVDSSHTSASITMMRVGDILNMTVPDSVISRGQYNVTLNNTLPFAPSYTMNAIFSNGTDTASTSTVTTSSQTCSFTAPTAYSPGNINFQGVFNINKAFLLPGEVAAPWQRIFPITDFGEQSYSTLVTLVPITVPVN